MSQQLPFAAKWKIAENDLIALKDSANGYLRSTYIKTSAGIQYRLHIYPNGNQDTNRGKVFVFLVLKLGNIKEVDVKYNIKHEYATNCNRVTCIRHIFKESGGWGKFLCNTADLFDAQKGFIRNGKMELTVDGIFFEKNEKTYYNVTSVVGNDLWASEETKDFKIVVNGKIIKVHKLVLAAVSPVFDDMFKSKAPLKNQLVISGFSYETVEWALRQTYGCNFSMINVLMDFRFFVKFKITYSLVGFMLFGRNDSKDYTIMVDGRTIMVHKLILTARSPTFATMLRSNTKEADQIEICDFSFNIVEKAVTAIYEYPHVYHLNDLVLIMQFLYKYGFTSTKYYVEGIAICRIDAATVCRLVNCALITKSKKLQGKCMEFLMSAFTTKTPLYGIDKLDKNVALKIARSSGILVDDKDAAVKILQDRLYHILCTQKEDASSSC